MLVDPMQDIDSYQHVSHPDLRTRSRQSLVI